MDVNKLSSDLQSQLRSDVVARSISQCVIELVENALDANASCIAIRINFESFRLEVVDDGVGITKEQLEFIGKRYYTSKKNDHAEKFDTSKYFGYRGEGLASIKNVSSRLLIVSQAQGEDPTYCKVFDNSSAILRESLHRRASKGTTIIVENILGNLPVRQKCTKSKVELQITKRYIQATALMFPTVNFSVRDDSKKSDILKIRRTNSTASTFRTLFPGAVTERTSMQKLVSKYQNLTIKAMISKEPCHTDELQFVFINKRYMPNSDIQTYLNQLLLKIDPPNEKRAAQKAVYVLNLVCPREEYDIVFEPDKRHVEFKHWSKVKKCLFELVKQLVNDESVLVDEPAPEKKETRGFAPTEAFHKLNTAHTVFGLTAKRKGEVEVFDIEDSSSNSSRSVSLLKKASPKRNESKISVTPKGSRKAKKNSKLPSKSPRLTEQGASLTYIKSPIRKMKPSEDPKACYRSIDAIVNESNSNEYAWIWNLPVKNAPKHPPERTEANGERARVRKKDEKQNANKNVKTMERYKSMEALSRRRMSQKSGRGRISKKCNTYFDDNPLERKDLISKYGNVKKNLAQNTSGDKPRSTDFEVDRTWDVEDYEHRQTIGESDQPENLEWTATLPLENSGISQTMIFNNQRSPELDCFNDNAIEFKARVERSPKREDFPLIPTQPWTDDECEKNNDLPLKKVSRRLNFDEEIDKDRSDNREAFDYKRKVAEWISKIPPTESIEIENPLTPMEHATGTDEIADEFRTEAEISKNFPNLDDSMREKSQLKFVNFQPDKWKSNVNKSRVQRYMIQSKVRHRPNNRSPKLLFKWKPKAAVEPSAINEILRTVDGRKNNQKENNIRELEKNEILTGELITPAGDMNWNCADDCTAANPPKMNDSYEANDVLNDIQNVVDSSQKSSCPSDCRCKCHRKGATEQTSTEPLEISEKRGVFASAENTPKDTVILIDSNPEQTANDGVMTCDDIPKDTEFGSVNEEDEERISTEPVMPAQHFNACPEDPEYSKYFSSRAELVEKLRFKLKSKFFESSSAIDIPKGMLEVQRSVANVEKLPDDEKKAVGELVKPYSMQNDITVDDYGNSCLRIFPFLKKNVEVLENREESLNCAVTFTKSDISSFQFMAQIENKFLLASAFVQSVEAPVLILLDQHAVDERIRVERLFKEYTQELRWLSTAINPPIHLSIPFNYSCLFTDYQSDFEEFGLFYEFNNVTENNQEKLLVSFTKVPTCFYNKATREKSNFRSILKRLIELLVKEMLKKFVSQGTLVHTIPNELQDVVNDEACRGAVKFGDKLSPQVCVALLEGLKYCNLPFQCAHGRPCLTPLVSLKVLEQFRAKVSELFMETMKNILCR